MTLPSSGSLDFNSIRAEFAGPSSNVTLSTYVRGSSYTYPVPANSNIPTSSSGSINVSDFYGAKGTARLAKFTASQSSSGGKVPSTYKGGVASSSFSDRSGYMGGNNIGDWNYFRSETNIATNFGNMSWTTSISSPSGSNQNVGDFTVRCYNTSGTNTMTLTTGTANFPGGTSVVTGGIGGGTVSPESSQWPTSGDFFIRDING